MTETESDKNEIQEFFKVVNELKHNEREGWRKHGVERPRDTIASHSFGAALLGWSLAEKEEANSDKVVKMLLMHDLIMAFVEDYTPEDEEFESKKEKEIEASERLFEKVPDSIEDEIRELFEELREQETQEACIAKDCDNLDTVLQASEYSEQSEGLMEEFVEFYKNKMRTEIGRDLFSELDN